MFFCDSCAEKNGWWQSLGRSYGPCEVCGVKRLCNDVPSSLMPAEVVRVWMPATTEVTFELHDDASTTPAKPALPLPNAFEETP
jgi:hypothetical protein